MTDPRRLPYDPKEIRKRLQEKIGDLLPRLGIRDRASGDVVTPLNLWRRGRPDRHAGSFVIWVSPADRAGAWQEYATGDKGSVFDLIAYTQRLREWIDAYWWALDFLNLERGKVRSAEQAQLDDQRAAEDRRAAEIKAQADEEGKSAALFKLWLSLPPIAGTPAETYLRQARGIPLERLRSMPGALRWAAAVDWVDPETGEVSEWRNCMVAAMTRGKKLAGLHRTYLTADGAGKAAIAKPKRMIGPVRGGAIRLSSGPSGKSPTQAEKAGISGPLAVGEGIETCLTVACARPDYRVWAAGSLSLMGLVEWPPCASAVVLLGENDWHPEARKAFAKVEAWWRGQARGRPVEVVFSQVGSDFNDWAKP